MCSGVVLTEDAYAKVNLYLHVTGRRADGYHLLDSLAVFPAVGDRLTAEAARDLSLTIDGPFAAALEGGDNLVLRAARRLDPARGAALRLTKNLPVASGIGGGSADAAAALRLLSRLWECPVPAGAALSLGADVAVCVAAVPARMQGVGEVLSRRGVAGFRRGRLSPRAGRTRPAWPATWRRCATIWSRRRSGCARRSVTCWRRSGPRGVACWPA